MYSEFKIEIKNLLDKIDIKDYIEIDNYINTKIELSYNNSLYVLKVTDYNNFSKHYTMEVSENKIELVGYSGFYSPKEATEGGLISYYKYIIKYLKIIDKELNYIKEW